MIFKRRCCKCRERKKIVYVDKRFLSYDLFIKDYYCENCNEVRIQLIELNEQMRQEQHLKMVAERQEEDRLKYLKEQVERAEIEEKARMYGIVYPKES